MGWVYLWVILIAAGIIFAVIRFVGASAQLASGVKTNARIRATKREGSQQWDNLMASMPSAPSGQLPPTQPASDVGDGHGQ